MANTLRADFPGRKASALFLSYSQLSTVIRYNRNQQQHHRRKSFSEEYVELLKRFNVPHDRRYLFQAADPN